MRGTRTFSGGGGGGGSPTNFTISKTHILESRWGGESGPLSPSGSVNVVLYLAHHSQEKAEGPPHVC